MAIDRLQTEPREPAGMLTEIVLAPVQPLGGRVAVHNPLAFCCDTVSPAARAADDHIRLHVHRSKHRGQDRQGEAVALTQSRRAIDPGGANVLVTELRECPLGVVERREHRRPGKCSTKSKDDPLGSAVLRQVIVDDGNRRDSARGAYPVAEARASFSASTRSSSSTDGARVASVSCALISPCSPCPELEYHFSASWRQTRERSA